LLLSSEERSLRHLAKRYNLKATDVDHIKKCFDTFDKDHSGAVDIQEFEMILYKALKIPAHVQLPPSRILYFWSEIDTDNSGKAQFEEFLQWWLKYFGGCGSKGLTSIDKFYSNIRRIGQKYLDPPVYSNRSSRKPAASSPKSVAPKQGQEAGTNDELGSPQSSKHRDSCGSDISYSMDMSYVDGDGAWSRQNS